MKLKGRFDSKRQARRWHKTTNPGIVPAVLTITETSTGRVFRFDMARLAQRKPSR